MGILDKIGSKKKEAIPNNPKQLWEVFYKTAMKSEWDTALELLQKLKKFEPNNPQLHIKLGDILQRKGDRTAAVSSYHTAAGLLMGGMDSQKAIAIFKIILRLDPKDAEAAKSLKGLLTGMNPGAEAPPKAATPPPSPPAAPAEDTTYESFGLGLPIDEAAGIGVPIEETAGIELPEEAPADEAAGIELPGEPHAVEEAQEAEPSSSGPETKEPPPIAGQYNIVINAISTHPIFSALNKEETDTLARKAGKRSFGDGDVVIKEDEPGDSLFIIVDGGVKVTSSMFGQTYELATLKKGDFFGETGFLTGRMRTATVVAEGKLRALEISKELLKEVTENNPALVTRLAEISDARTQRTIGML